MKPQKEPSDVICAIKNYCTENKITYREISERTGYSQSQISRFLSNKHDTGITVLERICSSLDLKICPIENESYLKYIYMF